MAESQPCDVCGTLITDPTIPGAEYYWGHGGYPLILIEPSSATMHNESRIEGVWATLCDECDGQIRSLIDRLRTHNLYTLEVSQ